MARQQNNNQPLFDLFTIIKYFALWILFSVVAFGIKVIVLNAIKISPTRQVGNGMLTLYEVHNTGAAFNLFSNQPEMIITASFLAVAIITFIVLIASGRLTQTAVSAMAFLSAGITLNMIERINQGYVIDYINCNFMPELPVFNVPDIMIVVGALGLILSVLTRR